ncbi:MAG: methyltransferase domain-containing protein [Promethearchaeota archaeon]|nr:MAG: methyltransferase domain-containing protein [Candidatus Lokiarchaeota archaeon]
MYKNYNILCTICARSGSKGIRGKNKVIVAGKPLIAYTVETAKECNYFDDVIISTDDEDIMKITGDYGIPASFKRPVYLSKDNTPKIDVIRHAVEWAEDNWYKEYEIIVDLSVVSPLRTVEDIKNSIELLINKKADNVFSVSPAYRNPYYNMIEIVDGKIKIVKESPKKLIRRQDAPEVYDMNDSINIWWKNILFKKNTLFNDNTKIYIMPRHRGIDIDEYFDLLVVSLILENWEKVFFLGYKDYWRKRVTTNNPQSDQSATESIFVYFFKKACSYLKESPKLLDVGCGYGRFFLIYAYSGFEIYGIDISREMIDEVKRKYKNVVRECKVSSAEKIEYSDNYFDMVVVWAVLDAVKQDQVIYEVFRVLKKDGVTILTGKNNNYYENDEKALIAEKRAKEKRCPNYFTDYNLMKEYIVKLGGEVVEEFFFRRRGDFGRLIYETEKPERFYEWCVIIKKSSDYIPNRKKCKFYIKYSKTWERMR